MPARVMVLDWPPNDTVTWSASFASSSCPIASSQDLNDALSFATGVSLGHFALRESAVVVSAADRVAFIAPKLLQKRVLSLTRCWAMYPTVSCAGVGL